MTRNTSFLYLAMSGRLIKDSVLSTVTVENFAQAFANGRRFGRPLAVVANHQWQSDFRKHTENEVDYLAIYIYYHPNTELMIQTKKICVEYAISVRNEKPNASRQFKCTRNFVPNDLWGTNIVRLSQIFAEDSGFLKNGALTVNVEIRAYAITDKEGVRQFNVYDPFEGCVKFKMGNSQKVFYASKQLIMHHSSVLAERIAAGEEEFVMDDCSSSAIEAFELYLQLGHGVDDVKVPEKHAGNVLQYAIQFDTYPTRFTNAQFKRVLKMVKSLEELKEVLEVHDRYVSDAETMKTVAREIFSFAVDFRWGPKKGV